MPRVLPSDTQATSLFPVDPDAVEQNRQRASEPIIEGTDVWNAMPTLAPKPRTITGTEIVEMDHASYIIEQAKLQAEGMISHAEYETDSILSDARASAIQIRDSSKTAGYNEGVVKARRDVESELQAAFDTRCKELHDSVEAIIAGFAEERELMWKSMETEITTLALDIAKKVVKIELQSNKDIVAAVVTDAMRRVSDRSSLRILVNPSELANVRACREDLMMALDGIKNMEIDADRRIGRGGCVIETNAGSVDAKIETQFEQVEAALET